MNVLGNFPDMTKKTAIIQIINLVADLGLDQGPDLMIQDLDAPGEQ
jgi:hypothetical protein